MARFEQMERSRSDAAQAREDREFERDRIRDEENRQTTNRMMLVQVKLAKVMTNLRNTLENVKQAQDNSTRAIEESNKVIRELEMSYQTLAAALLKQEQGQAQLSFAIDALKLEIARKADRGHA